MSNLWECNTDSSVMFIQQVSDVNLYSFAFNLKLVFNCDFFKKEIYS